jgi:parvulin-like peptidyl-prolyl isomerase
MKPLQLTFLAALAALTLALTACGSGSDVPDGVVAVVDGTEITRKQLDELVEQAKKTYEAQQSEFPKVGTPEYQNVQKQYVAVLVQREQFKQEAEERGLEVTDKEADAELKKFIDSRFGGKEKELDAALKEQGYSKETLREELRYSVLSQKLFDAVTKEVEVPAADVLAFYQQNQSQYSTPESRDVRHILVSEKNGTEVDFEASKTKADQLYGELQNGADFTAIVRQHSDDTQSVKDGGKLTITRGMTVPEFDKTAFDIEQGVVSEPVKTTYGYHLIEALSPVRKAKTTPIAKVRASIKATLLQERRDAFAKEWAEDTNDEYAGKTEYALGFEPPELPEETEPEETETVPVETG